ncbi:MAG: GatB/YqeY domain-containing protein, partial [Terriglobales bacterium]
MALSEKIQQDMVAAMKSREELRLSTLRMMKSAIQYRKVEIGHD